MNTRLKWILDFCIILAFSFLFITFNFGCTQLPIQRSDASGYGPKSQKKMGTNYSSSSLNSPLGDSISDDQFGTDTNQNIDSYTGPLDYKLMTKLGLTTEALKDPELFKRYQLLLNINAKEKQLSDDREKKQYYSAQSWFRDDKERLEFLNQPGYEARLLWMRKNNFGNRSTKIETEMLDVIEKKDIVLGMSQEWVKKSWGPPDAVDVAGNPIYKNERWKYRKYVPSSEGFKLQRRLVYFEGGKVVGWEQADE